MKYKNRNTRAPLATIAFFAVCVLGLAVGITGLVVATSPRDRPWPF